MAQQWVSPISINSGQVPSTQTDFPVLVSQTDNRFKTIGNGGHVNNSSGFDIRPYSDSGCTTAITGYELERYNGTTGEVVMWVKVGSLSSSTTPIYLGYGDTGISTDGSSGSTCFSNGFLAVYHLKDGTTLSVADSVGAHNGTNNNATAAAGKIDGCCNVASASSQYINCGTIGTGATTSITTSAWVNGTTFPGAYNVVILRNAGNTTYDGIYVKSTGKIAWTVSTGNQQDGTGSNTLSTGTWYLLHFTYSGSTITGYVNGSQDVTAGGGGTLSNGGLQTDIGRDNVNGRYFNGALDECRLANVARSANWITTEYNNQSAPGTFETLGAESAVSAGSTGNMFLVF